MARRVIGVAQGSQGALRFGGGTLLVSMQIAGLGPFGQVGRQALISFKFSNLKIGPPLGNGKNQILQNKNEK